MTAGTSASVFSVISRTNRIKIKFLSSNENNPEKYLRVIRKDAALFSFSVQTVKIFWQLDRKNTGQ